MFKSFFKARKTPQAADYYDAVREYVLKTYIPPVTPQAPPVAPPADPAPSAGSGAKYSVEIDPFVSDYFRDTRPKFSARMEKEHETKFSFDDYDSEAVDAAMRGGISERSAADFDAVLDRAVKQSFVDRVIEIIREKGIRDSAVYKAAQIDRRLFSKMMSDRSYKPAKDTAVAIALALKLPLAEANDLLGRAGYTLSHSNKRDVVIEYFFRERMYDLANINSVLLLLRLKLIGR